VGVFESGGDLGHDLPGVLEGHRAARRFAFDVLHDQSANVFRFGDSVDRGDVGVVEGGEDFGFALEAGGALGVAGEIDFALPPLPIRPGFRRKVPNSNKFFPLLLILGLEKS